MTKRRGPGIEQRGEIEMPPLDHVFPAEMGVPQAAPLHAKEVEEKPLYHEQVQEEYEEVPVEQDEVESIEEVDQEEPELAPTPMDTLSKKPKTKEDNFREVRLAKERAERERDALLSQMLEMQSKLQAQQQVQQPKPVIEEKEWFDDIDPESLVEGKQVKKIAEDMRSMKKLLQEQQMQAQQLAMEAKIKSQYPDFDQVFNADNINQLNSNYPDIANALRAMPDDYGKATAAYTMIKNLGIANHQKGNEVKKQTYESDILKAKVNAAKPRPLTSVNPQQGDSPLSKANAFANGLTSDLKAQMLKEMQDARKGH